MESYRTRQQYVKPEQEQIMTSRKARIATICSILSTNPNRTYPLAYFQERLGAAKSSISEDIAAIRTAWAEAGIGNIESISGLHGGVRFIPNLLDAAGETLQEILGHLTMPWRVLPGGLLYLWDVFSTPRYVDAMASTMASWFQNSDVRRVVTVETKGIPLAMSVARLLDVPLAIARHETKLTDGPSISAHYTSGSTRRVQTLSISKRTIAESEPVVIIDDFISGGGTIRAIADVLEEMHVPVAGIGAALVRRTPARKKIDDYHALFWVGELSPSRISIELFEAEKTRCPE